MAIVRPGNEGVMATVITRRAINPKRKKVRLMTWARPYANVSRFGTGREQGSHLIRVRAWESELENGFDTAPISPRTWRERGRSTGPGPCRPERQPFIRSPRLLP